MKYLIFIFLLFFYASSYSQKKALLPIDSIYSVADICFYDFPFSNIVEFDINKKTNYDTINSIASTNNIMQYLDGFGKIKYPKLDTIHSNNLFYYYNLLSKTLDSFNKPDYICSVFKAECYNSTSKRFICFVLQNGYYLTKKKNLNNNLTSLAVGLLTLGTAIPYTYKASSKVYFIIIDKISNKIIYFDSSILFFEGKEMPFYKETTDYQLHELIFKLQDRVTKNIDRKKKLERKLEKKLKKQNKV